MAEHVTDQRATQPRARPQRAPVRADRRRAARTAARRRRRRRASRSSTCDDVNVCYGEHRAVRDVTLELHSNEITALIGPSGCGKSTFIRCLNRMNDLIPTARVEGEVVYHGEDLYDDEDRPRPGAQAHRHGLPEAEPVPEVDLRQHRLRPARDGHEGRHGRDRRERAAPRRAVGRGQGPAEDQRVRHVGRPAAAPVHRPRAGHRARRAADGRAVLGARPDLDRPHRGPDDGAQGELLDRHRHPQHAAGRARVGHDGVLHGRARRTGSKHRTGARRRVRGDREDLHEPGRQAHRGLRHRQGRGEWPRERAGSTSRRSSAGSRSRRSARSTWS